MNSRFYPKGGPFSKWYGNNWIVIKYNDPDVYTYLKTHGNKLPSEAFYLKEGVTYCSSGSRGCSFRYMPQNQVISGAGPGIYPSEKFVNIYYYLAFLNSLLSIYLLDCLNPTVNVTQGDIKRIPFANPPSDLEKNVATLSKQNVQIKSSQCKYSMIEYSFVQSPIQSENDIRSCIFSFYTDENGLNTLILLNESYINFCIFKVYSLSKHDQQLILDKEGYPVGDYSVSSQAKEAYKKWLSANTESPASQEVLEHIDSLEINEDQP